MKQKDLWSVGIYSPLGSTTGRYELIFTNEDRAVKFHNHLKRIQRLWKYFRPAFIYFEDDYGVKLSIATDAIGAVYIASLVDSHRRNVDVGDTQHVVAEAYKSDVDIQPGFKGGSEVGREDE